MGIRGSLSPVYEKDDDGVQRLVGYKSNGPTNSQKKRGITPKDGFGIGTLKQKKAVVVKNSKAKETQEKILKRRGLRKKKD